MFVASLWWKVLFSQKPYLFFALDFFFYSQRNKAMYFLPS